MNKLFELVNIRAGHSFRGKLIDDPQSNTLVLQIKDLQSSGLIDWQTLVHCKPIAKRKEWLRKDDILFVAKGSNNQSFLIDSHPPVPTLVAPIFFHISLKEKARRLILPKFLVWQLNQKPAQDYFAQNSQGGLSKNIKKDALESTPIFIPSLEEQKLIIELNQTVNSEKIAAEKLIENGQILMTKVSLNLAKNMRYITLHIDPNE